MSSPRTQPVGARRGGTRRSLLLAVAALVAGSVFPATGAQADTREQRDQVRRERAAVAAQIDTLRASDAEVEAALAALNENVSAQESAVSLAQQRAANSQAALDTATAEVEAKEAEIGDLRAAVQEAAVAAYVRPPQSGDLMESLSSSSIGEAELKRSLLDANNASQFDALDQLTRAQEDLESARAQAEDAAIVAEADRESAETELAELTTAQEQQEQVLADVEARLDRSLAEAANLAELDEELSNQLQQEQAALAARLARERAAARAAAPPAPSGGGSISIVGSGSIVSVRGIQVHQSIADNLAAMLSAADAAGINLSGGGYRSPQSQIAVRRANCGSSNYAIYQAPSSYCSPPTAPPGRSMHEQGLAIDFQQDGSLIRSRSTSGYQWMAANAASYGFYNLPSEPWHWSVNGR